MTFLRQIQNVLERTYASTGVNLEEFLIGRQRCVELSARTGPEIREFSGEGITFFRVANGQLHIAIYYHPSVIARLERHYPLAVLDEQNIRALIVFIEELSHAIHAAIFFLEKKFDPHSEEFLCNLELQARVDTYLALKLITASLLRSQRLPEKYQAWIRRCVFQREFKGYQQDRLRKRYCMTSRLGLRLIKHLDTLDAGHRIRFIRKFRALSFSNKKDRICSAKP